MKTINPLVVNAREPAEATQLRRRTAARRLVPQVYGQDNVQIFRG